MNGSVMALMAGWLADLALGDPRWLPHPVVAFGRAIAVGERWLNRGTLRRQKGALMAVTLVVAVFFATWGLRRLLELSPGGITSGHTGGEWPVVVVDGVLVFFCLAGTTLVREVRAVFVALERSLDDGRRQVARIVGRDTQQLSAQEVRTAALETLAENLSDGVVAPLFWLALLGTPGMMAYKMVNTLDSMIGYRTERYRRFGCVAARLDDVANYLPARLTAMLMLVAARLWPATCRPLRGKSRLAFVATFGRQHASPNSGYPEAALAAILDCRFGGPHTYFGQTFDKPYIGDHERLLTSADATTAIRISRTAEAMAVGLTAMALLV